MVLAKKDVNEMGKDVRMECIFQDLRVGDRASICLPILSSPFLRIPAT